ncbi:hypothetical protein [Wolbachia pipientis]|nr:hypothetical protein [Wolbachia pipientis]
MYEAFCKINDRLNDSEDIDKLSLELTEHYTIDLELSNIVTGVFKK